MSRTTVFLSGATGYIGGEILYQLLLSDAYDVTALVRTQKKAETLEKQTGGRIKTVLGTLDDLDVIRGETERADVIITAADADHVPSIQAIAEVLKKKSTKGVLVHTSGSGILMDINFNTRGLTAPVYSDVDSIDQIYTFADDKPHRPVEKIAFSVEEENPLIKTVIVSPSTIFGKSRGYDNVYSVQIPYLAKISADLKKGFTVEKGDSIWSHVHIADLGDLYNLLLAKILAGEDIPTGKKGYYFGAYPSDVKPTDISPVEHTWKQVADRVSEVLFEKGLAESKEAVAFSGDEIYKFSGEKNSNLYWGTDSRCRGDNGVRVGWIPKYDGADDFWNSIEEDVEYALANLV